MTELKGAHKEFLTMLLNKMDHWEKDYLETSNEGFLAAYNQAAERPVCLRTIYYYQARLKEHLAIKKESRRTENDDGTWKIKASMTCLLKEGKRQLKRLGVPVYDILKKISTVMADKKEESSRGSIREDSRDDLKPLNNSIKEIMKKYKPE